MTGEAQKELTKQLVEAVQQELNLGSLEDDALRREIDGMLDRAAAGQYLSLDQRVAIVGDVYARFRGFGPLDAILRDDSVTEIMVNGPQHIFIERKGEILPLDRSFESEEALLQVIRRITRLGGREVNQSSPIVDTRLPDGSRVNVVLKPIALNGHILTIRKFSSEPMTMERLIRYGSLTPEIASFLERLVKARYNIFISGGTGSG